MFEQEPYEAAYQAGRRWAESLYCRFNALGDKLPEEWPFSKEDAAALVGSQTDCADDAAQPGAAIAHAAAQLRWRQLFRSESGVVKCAVDVDREAPTAPAVPAAHRSARPAR